MAETQAMTHTIMQTVTEAAKAAVKDISAATETKAGAIQRSMASNMGPKQGRPFLKQGTL